METVTLRAFDNYFSANILLTRLRDAGIECYLKDEYTITIDPLLSNALGGIKLIVKKEKLQEAIDTLHALENQEIIPPVCTLCGGKEFIEVPVKNANNYVKGMLTWLFKGDNEVTDIFYKCANCGKETEQLPYPES